MTIPLDTQLYSLITNNNNNSENNLIKLKDVI